MWEPTLKTAEVLSEQASETNEGARVTGSSGASAQDAGRTMPVGTVTATPPTPGTADEPRRVRLTLTRVNPFSVMKIAFLLSVALGIAGVVVAAVLWTMLNGIGVFEQVNDALGEIPAAGTTARINIYDYVGFGRVLSLSVVFGVADVILMTAMATVGAFLYNICAALVGGLGFTLSDD